MHVPEHIALCNPPFSAPHATAKPTPRAPSSPDNLTASFGDLYREHYPAIAGLIYRRTGDAHLTEDLTADVFLAAYSNLHAFRASSRDGHANLPVIIWLRRIAHNRVNRWFRRSHGLRAILQRLAHPRACVHAAHPATPDAAPDTNLRAFHRLPIAQQEVLSAHYFEHMSLDEVALMLGITPEAAKSRLARARDALRTQLLREPHS